MMGSIPEKVILAAVAMVLGASSVEAAPITVPNGSFETPAAPTQTTSSPNVISGWVFNVKGGSSYGTAAISSNFSSAGTSSGSNYAFINNDALSVTDTITSAASLAKIATLTKYTLSLAIGNRTGAGLYKSPGDVSFSLLANGVAFATQTVTNGTVTDGTFQTFTLTFTTPSVSALAGEDLTIQLASLPQQGNAFQPAFDNVTLDATSIAIVPEPSTFALMISAGCVLLGLVRRGRSRGAARFQN